MAKQKGLHKLAGKVDDQSYYYSKNGGYQSRKINPGIGERVKSAPEYANTRLNNAEFGAAGACAGAMIREVNKRWRYILISNATGLMVKEIKALMEQDTTSPWGQRVIQLANMPSVQEKYNQFSKNQMLESIVNFLDSSFEYDETTHELSIGGEAAIDLSLGQPNLDYLHSIKATGFRCSVYVFGCSAPTFVPLAHKYLPAVSSISAFASSEVEEATISSVVISSDASMVSIPPINTQVAFGGVLVIFEPLRKVGTSVAVLQQHCSAYWKAVKTATNG